MANERNAEIRINLTTEQVFDFNRAARLRGFSIGVLLRAFIDKVIREEKEKAGEAFYKVDESIEKAIITECLRLRSGGTDWSN